MKVDGLVTKNIGILPFMVLFLDVFGLITGVLELKTRRSRVISIMTAAFAFFVAIYTF